MEHDLASLYRELMDDPMRVAGPGELDSDQPTEDLIYDESGLVIGAAGKLVSDEPATDACAHQWNFVRDWYGDPNVINGTADCSFWRCRKCGEETNEQPDDWNDGPDPDEYRERMEDGSLK